MLQRANSTLMLAWVSFLVGVAIWPGLYNFAIAPRWAVFGIGCALVAWFTEFRLTKAHWPVVALLSWAAVSLIWTPVFYDGLNAFVQLGLMALAFCIGAEQEDMTPVYRAAGWAVTVSAVIACFQMAGISPVMQFSAPAGLFGNKNLLAEYAVLVLVLLIGRNWLALPALFVVIATHSRGVWLALMVVCIVWLWNRWRKAAYALASLLAFASAAFLLSPLRHTLDIRLLIWADVLEMLRPLGNGIGSYFALGSLGGHQLAIGWDRALHAHNDFLEYGFELGLPFVAFLLWIAYMTLQFGEERETLALLAIAVTALFGFPLHSPAMAFLGSVVAGHAVARGVRLLRGVDGGGGRRFVRHFGVGNPPGAA